MMEVFQCFGDMMQFFGPARIRSFTSADIFKCKAFSSLANFPMDPAFLRAEEAFFSLRQLFISTGAEKVSELDIGILKLYSDYFIEGPGLG